MILLGTSNPGKIKEYQAIFTGTQLKIKNLGDFPEIVNPPEETGNSYQENALLKAHYYYQHYKLPVITEDAGVEFSALNNFPGLHAAPFMEECGSADQTFHEIARRINQLNKPNLQMTYQALICYYNPPEPPQFFTGNVEGHFTYPPRGNMGFGYDPAFTPLGYDKTFAELDPEIKNQISHRRQAAEKLLTFLLQNA